MHYARLLIAAILLLATTTEACGQVGTDLPSRIEQEQAYNRTASVRAEDGMHFVHLDARPGDGLLWIPDIEFREGTIEVRLRGRNEPGRSFVGIAFNGANDSTYEAVYVRPFNFRSDAPKHSLQYIAMPGYPWNVLRSSTPGEFESAIEPTPVATGWLRLRLEVEAAEVRVYAGEGDAPDLVAQRLAASEAGRVGLWVGNQSEGDFASVAVEHAEHAEHAEAADPLAMEEVTFRSNGVPLSGTIVYPTDALVDAAVVFVHGSGTMPRNLALARRFAERGIAALVYDKRGVGRSGGAYADDMSISGPNIDLLADDAAAALETIRERFRDVPAGFVGFSQAGWIVPLAAEKASSATFMALWSGCVCKMSEEDLFSIYTSDRDRRGLIAFDEMRALREEPYVWSERLGRDTDAVESLARLDIPGFWVFGAIDGSIPVDLSIRNLTHLVRRIDAQYDYTVLAGTGHATVDRGFGAVVDWIKTTTPRAAQAPRPKPDLNALAGTYVYPDPPITVTIARKDTALTAEVKGSILLLEHLDGASFVGHDPGNGYVYVDFEPIADRLIATEQGRSYTFERESKR